MDAIFDYFKSLDLDYMYLLKIGLILLLGTFVTSLFGRFVFGKRSTLNKAVSASIGILFVYALTVVFHSLGAKYEQLIAPLPFISISGDTLSVFSFEEAHYTLICSEVLSMIILAFLVNLADSWLPKGNNIFTWIFFRCLTVAIALTLHLIAVGLLAKYLPEGLVTYAPVVLLIILVLLLLTGVLKLLVGVVLTTVNPLIGGLYTFFFATIVGKQISKAVMTTALLSVLVMILNYAGCVAISIASAALIAYIPFLILLVLLWYVVYRVL